VTHYKVFRVLDTLRPTATGLDKLPAWFLRLAAPILCGPFADLINTSLLTSTVLRAHPACSENADTAAGRGLSATPVHAFPHY